MWLLKVSSPGGWDVIPVSGPDGLMTSLFWPSATSLLSAYQYTAVTPVADMAVLELANAAEATNGRPEMLLFAAEGLDSPVVEGVLQRFLGSTDTAFRAIGLAGLLERGDQNSVRELQLLWPSMTNEPMRIHVISAVRDAFRSPDVDGIQRLMDVANAFADLRGSAVAALAAVHTGTSLPFLAGLLMSADPAERMKGVFGLSSFANGCPAQTPGNIKTLQFLQFASGAPYRTADTISHFAFRRGPANLEAAVVSFWLDWWNNHHELWK
jgi:hypothetical protein